MSDLPPFGLLVIAHGEELLAHARKLSGADAEDVLQEALLRALRSYPSLRDDSHLRAWLYRIVTTTAFDNSKRRSREVVGVTPERTEVQTYDDGFESLLDGLTAPTKEALMLRFSDDLSYAQIAGRLKITPEAARQRVSSGVRALRRKLS